MKYLLLASSVLVAVMHGAAPDAEEILRKIIMRRSLDDFKSKKSEIKELYLDEISSLQCTCSYFLEALDVLSELHEHPGVLDKLNEMRIPQIIVPKSSGFQALLISLFSSPAHKQAVEISKRLESNPGAKAALDNIAGEFNIPYEQFCEKLSSEQKNLKDIVSILQVAERSFDFKEWDPVTCRKLQK